jgi:hypothetical protein
MNLDTMQPPVNLIADFQDLQLAISNDRSGDKTRQMLDYLKESEQKCLEIHLRSAEFEEKQFAKMLQEAFAAATEITRTGWQKAHDAELAV